MSSVPRSFRMLNALSAGMSLKSLSLTRDAPLMWPTTSGPTFQFFFLAGSSMSSICFSKNTEDPSMRWKRWRSRSFVTMARTSSCALERHPASARSLRYPGRASSSLPILFFSGTVWAFDFRTSYSLLFSLTMRSSSEGVYVLKGSTPSSLKHSVPTRSPDEPVESAGADRGCDGRERRRQSVHAAHEGAFVHG